MSPFASSPAPLVPWIPGSFVGSVPGVIFINGEVTTPSEIPSPFVSCWIPLSSSSCPLSALSVGVDDTANEAGGKNSTV